MALVGVYELTTGGGASRLVGTNSMTTGESRRDGTATMCGVPSQGG